MNKRLGLIAAIGLTVLKMCGCQKESKEAVLYLPTDENAYVGGTCISVRQKVLKLL